MPWVVSFIIAWLLFIVLVDKSRLKYNVFGGLLALFLATIVDWGGQNLGLYEFRNLIIPWFGCSAFYKFGPVFTMGILFSQSVPNKNYKQAINILIFTILFIGLEFLIVTATNVAHYIHWHILASVFVDILALTAITWFTNEFLKNNKCLL